MAIAPLESMTGFAPNNSSGWGQDASGRAWEVWTPGPTAKVYITGRKGVMYVPQQYGNQYARLAVPSRAAREVLALAEHNVGNYLVSHGPMIGMSSATRGYALRVTGTRVAIVAVDGAANITEMNGVDTSRPANTKLWMRLRYDAAAGQIRGKVWTYGTAEPSAWTVSSGVGSYSITGRPGYWARGMSATYQVKVHAFYSYDLSDTESVSFPITETFNNEYEGGWGQTPDGRVWRGHFNFDPDLYSNPPLLRKASGLGLMQASGSGDWIGYLAPQTRDSAMAFRVHMSHDNALVYAGLRGRFDTTGGTLRWLGYIARIQANSNRIYLYRKSSVTGSTTQIASATLPITLQKNIYYWILFQAVGSTLQVKVWQHGQSQPADWNLMYTDSGAITQAGSPFIRVVANNSDLVTFHFEGFDATVVTSVNSTTTNSFNVTPQTDRSARFEGTFLNDDNNNVTVTAQWREKGTTTWSSYQIESQYINHTANPRTVTRTLTWNASNDTAGKTFEARLLFSDPDGVQGTNPRTTEFTFPQRGTRPLDITATATGSTITATATYQNDTDNDMTVLWELFHNGNRIRHGAGTIDRTAKKATFTAIELLPDTTYVIRATFSDPDEVFGTNPLEYTIQTLGRGVELVSLGANAGITSAILTATYAYDTNNNSSMTFQYRSLRDMGWTTVGTSQVSVDREDKVFRTVISGLYADMSYEVRAVVSDPDGVIPGSPTERTTRFTTQGVLSDGERRGKQHVYRVYSGYDGRFLGTWPDAPDPEFSIQENGGVTNLSVRLPRSLSDLNYDPSIDFMNRVDVWCVDGESLGMGKNMVHDWDFSKMSWVATNSSVWKFQDGFGPDGRWGARYHATSGDVERIVSEFIEMPHLTPIVVTALAQARGGKIRMDIEAFDADHNRIIETNQNAETVGTLWQELLLEWLPPPGTAYVRIRFENVGTGTMYVSHVKCLAKEQLIYRGTIETFTPNVTAGGEWVDIDILGLTSFLTDDYVEFKQWVAVQPVRDRNMKLPYSQPTDPGNMFKELIDLMRKQNPKCPLFYTSDSIQLTGETREYTLRNQQFRDAFDKIRNICPPNWHWFVDPAGCVHLRGPEHVETHKLRIGVEVLEYSNEKSIRNLKNHIIFRGRQDEDGSEPDGHGTIRHEAFNQQSIDRYGIRTLTIRDANVTDPVTAETVAEGRLAEYGVVEEAGRARIPDEKDTRLSLTSLRGYNVQAFFPGDLVEIKDPKTGPNRTFWDQFKWDEGVWDTTESRVIPQAVPIKNIDYRGDHVVLELSYRAPSANADFARMAGLMRNAAQRESFS